MTKAIRPIKSFNIENRAHRVISKEKPTPAPRYPENLEDLKRTLEADPDIDEKLDRKDEDLDERLKEVYVTSHGKPEDDVTKELKDKKSKERSLPQDRKLVEDFDFGFKEPEKLRYGKTTIRHAINFISAHQINPEEVTAAKIAVEYKMREEDVATILKYFRTFEVYIPETKTAPAVFAGPSALRKQLYKADSLQIENKSDTSLESKNVSQNKDSI